MCVETGQVFNTSKEAAQWLNVVPSTLSQVLNGYANTAGGYHWIFLNSEKEEPVVVRPRSRPSMTIREVQLEAERRTRETGRLVRYADIQKEETMRLMKLQEVLAARKKRKEEKR